MKDRVLDKQQPSLIRKSKWQVAAVVVLVAVATTLCLSLFGCGGSGNGGAANTDTSSSTSNSSSSASTASDSNTPANTATDSGNFEWRQFMKDYEAWVDSYVTFMKKYKENPTDTSLASEATKLAEESITWSQQVEEWDQKSMSADELKEFLEIYNRINQKITSVL